MATRRRLFSATSGGGESAVPPEMAEPVVTRSAVRVVACRDSPENLEHRKYATSTLHVRALGTALAKHAPVTASRASARTKGSGPRRNGRWHEHIEESNDVRQLACIGHRLWRGA